MSLFRRGNLWHEFWFANWRVRESAKTASKTLAKAAEEKCRRELETGFNNLEDACEYCVRTIREIAEDCLASYDLRIPGRPRSPSMPLVTYNAFWATSVG
jgi:hypothetical protein